MDDNSAMKIDGDTVVGTELYNTAKLFTVPEGITKIGKSAFDNCYHHLEEVILPQTLQIIEESGFAHCRALKRLNIPAGVKQIGKWAFGGTGLRAAVIPDGITRLEEYTFCCSSVRTVELPDTLEFIGHDAFQDSMLETIFIPKGVKIIERDVFKKCKNLKIYCEGEPCEGWERGVETVVDREYYTTDEDDAFNFHRSSGGFTSHVVETKRQVEVSWNPDDLPVFTNVSREEYKKIIG